MIYGSEDVILPYDGGLGDVIRQMFGAEPVVEGTSVEEQQSAIDSIPFPSGGRWPTGPNVTARATRPSEEEVSAEVTLRTWRGCDAPAELRIYVVDGGGHPGRAARS